MQRLRSQGDDGIFYCDVIDVIEEEERTKWDGPAAVEQEPPMSGDATSDEDMGTEAEADPDASECQEELTDWQAYERERQRQKSPLIAPRVAARMLRQWRK